MKFKNCVVGLRVQSKTNVNKIGTVVFVEPSGYDGYLGVRVQWDDGATLWGAHGRIRKYVEPTKEPLKVGDKVKVLPFTVHESATCGRVYVEAMLPTIGVVGEVIEVQDDGYRVYFKGLRTSWSYCPQYLERVA